LGPASVEYELRVLGRLGPAAAAAFGDVSVQERTTMTVLSGAPDQRTRALGLELVDVRRV
jgi:hypothetical protein